MKKVILRIAILAISLTASTQANAQLSKTLKSAASSLLSSKTGDGSALSTAVSAVTNLIGTKTVTKDNLVGTWTYSQPCVAFESKNVLSNLGGSVASTKIEKTLASKLKLIGFTQGKVVMTLNEDGSGVIKVNKKETKCTWAVDGSTMTLTFTTLNKSVKTNVKMSGSDLQVAMDASKLLTLLTTISDKASAVSSSLKTVSSLVKNVDGLYLGLKFTK